MVDFGVHLAYKDTTYLMKFNTRNSNSKNSLIFKEKLCSVKLISELHKYTKIVHGFQIWMFALLYFSQSKVT